MCTDLWGPIPLDIVQDRSADGIVIHTKLWCQHGLNCDEVLTLLHENRDKGKQYISIPLSPGRLKLIETVIGYSGKGSYPETARKVRVNSLELYFTSSEV
jgi:hypothetical protein